MLNLFSKLYLVYPNNLHKPTEHHIFAELYLEIFSVYMLPIIDFDLCLNNDILYSTSHLCKIHDKKDTKDNNSLLPMLV